MPQPVRLRMCVPSPAPRASLCDALDQLLDTGVVVAGELTIKVADVELLYVALELVAGSWESMQRLKDHSPPRTQSTQRNAEWVQQTAAGSPSPLRSSASSAVRS